LQCDLHVLQRFRLRLLRQGIHQIQIDIIEMALRDFNSPPRFRRRVDAP
jgi:hypothetical protein